MKKVVNAYDALNELTRIQEEEGLYDNEGSDIYTEDELKDWDSTLLNKWIQAISVGQSKTLLI
jgi:hypothetical protein